jgi:hypothetical protein
LNRLQRESTTIEKVRDYHTKFYRPENLYITVTGNVDGKQVPIRPKVRNIKLQLFLLQIFVTYTVYTSVTFTGIF